MASEAAPPPPPPPPWARLLAADELGLVRCVDVPPGPSWGAAGVVATWGAADRASAVLRLALSTPAAPGGLAAIGRKGGRFSVVAAEGGAPLCDLGPSTSGGGRAAGGDAEGAELVGLSFLHPRAGADAARPTLITATHAGTVALYAAAAGGGGYGPAPLRTLAGAGQAHAFALSTAADRVALGGQASHLQVLDLETGAKLFVPRGNKPDQARARPRAARAAAAAASCVARCCALFARRFNQM